MKTSLARIAKAYADQGPGPTLAVLMALMAAIGQAELTLAPPRGLQTGAVVLQPAPPPAATLRSASAESAALLLAP
jgi:hypothetical protein